MIYFLKLNVECLKEYTGTALIICELFIWKFSHSNWQILTNFEIANNIYTNNIYLKWQ